MVVLSTSILLLNNSTIINNLNNITDKTKFLANNTYILIYISLLLLVTALPAVLVSINCNRDYKVLYGSIAFFFSDIYLLQWAIKKFILKRANYC
jgi:hypothetical protein